MEKRPRPAELLSILLRQNRYSRQELDHLFRLLSKRSHPDATGGSGEEFIELRRVYERARTRLGDTGPEFLNLKRQPLRRSDTAIRTGSRQEAAAAVFDPSRIIREEGYDESLSSRGCLFLSLKVFFNLGLYNHRVRSLRGLQRRNADILRTIDYWARIYDPAVAAIFNDYSGRTFQSLSTTWEIKNFNYAKRLFLDGVAGFFNYQVSGRTGTAEVARDKFTWCSYTLRKVIRNSHPMTPMAEWFLRELEAPPELNLQ